MTEPKSNATSRKSPPIQELITDLLDRWNVTDEEAMAILGSMPIETLHLWKNGNYGHIDDLLSGRISQILNIHKALLIIFNDDARCYSWIKAKNKTFDGLSALDILKQGSVKDTARIRCYLDSISAA